MIFQFKHLHSRCIFLFVFFLALILCLHGTSVFSLPDESPIVTGNWSTDFLIYHANDPSANFDLNSSLSFSYSLDGFDLTSLSRFTNPDSTPGTFHRQNFGLNTRIGILALNSKVVFYPKEGRMDYWLNEASATFAGITITNKFLLQHTILSSTPRPTYGYGAGTELIISGKTSEGLSVEVSGRFGMEESVLEQEGIEEGSGYDIVTDGGRFPNLIPFAYPPSQLQFVSSTIELSDLSLGCCTFDSTTWISREKGFEYTELDFYIDSENMPVSIDTEIQFAPKKKKGSIDPQLITEDECFDLYLDFSEKDSSSSYNLALKGFGLHIDQPLTISNITSLKGNLYKRKGADDITLRASDYVIDPVTPAYFDGPLNFDQVFSLVFHPGNLAQLYLDVYFNMTESDQLFDLQKLTGQAKYTVSEQLQVGTGIAITPEEDITFMLEMDVSF